MSTVEEYQREIDRTSNAMQALEQSMKNYEETIAANSGWIGGHNKRARKRTAEALLAQAKEDYAALQKQHVEAMNAKQMTKNNPPKENPKKVADTGGWLADGGAKMSKDIQAIIDKATNSDWDPRTQNPDLWGRMNNVERDAFLAGKATREANINKPGIGMNSQDGRDAITAGDAIRKAQSTMGAYSGANNLDKATSGSYALNSIDANRVKVSENNARNEAGKTAKRNADDNYNKNIANGMSKEEAKRLREKELQEAMETFEKSQGR